MTDVVIPAELSRFAVAAAHELGVFGRTGTVEELARELGVVEPKLRVLVEVLVAMGALVERGGQVSAGVVPARVEVVPSGWGRLAEVIRTGRPVELEGTARAYHAHLVRAGAAAARELAAAMGDGPLIDLGGGAGAYTRAFLEGDARRRATLVDDADVLALAREELAAFGERVTFVAGDARDVGAGAYGAAALVNVLHLHPPDVGRALCAAAARAVRPGGRVIVKDLRVDDGRRGPLDGLMFALNMVVYTAGGDVYEVGVVKRWMEEAGLVDVEERRLAAAPGAVVLVGEKPEATPAIGDVFEEVAGVGGAAAVADELDAALARNGEAVWRELRDGGRLLGGPAGGTEPERLAFPATIRRLLATAVALERQEGEDERAVTLERHYTELMPRQRIEQLAAAGGPGEAFFHVPLDWARLPRLAGAIDRLVGVLGASGVDPAGVTAALGAPDGAALRARTPTLAALYRRTHYGGFMPLLYGCLADLAYFERRAADDGLDVLATIDRYFTAPLVHELCHFAPGRDALVPPHLDECVAGWLGVHVLPEFAYPAGAHDDAIYAAPLLSQIGVAMARAFGVAPLVRAHAGAEPWTRLLPAGFLDAAVRLGWDDWRLRRTVHFLSDTLEPRPWVALALVAGAGRPLSGHSLASLAEVPLVELAGELPPDPAFDRAIVEDGLRAMCLWNECRDGSFRTRTVLPDEPIAIDAAASSIHAPRRGPVDTVPPRFWLPPAVGAALLAAGARRCTLRLTDVAAIPAAAEAVCAGRTDARGDGFALEPAGRARGSLLP